MNEWQPSTDAEDLARLDTQIATLSQRLEQARQVYAAADAALRATQQRRRDVYARLVLGGAQHQPGSLSQAAVPAPSSGPDTPLPAGPPYHPAPEASTRTVQNVLFVLGGLLLGTAAVVFTAVAWSRYGVTGRAVILAVVTALALLTPPVALWRRLTATAETFAAVGLLLVVLDGYAAWYVNLFGVQSIPATRYAGVAATVTAGVALAYRLATRLVGPGLVALTAAQPVLPLLLAGESLTSARWSLVFAAVALLDLGVLWRTRTRSGVAAVVMRAGAWLFFAVALLVAAIMAYLAEIVAGDGPDAALAGLSVVVVGLLLVGGAMVTRSSDFQALAGCVLVLAVVAAAGRFVDVAWPRYAFVLVAVVVAVTTILSGLAARPDAPLVPAPLRPGLAAGGLIAAGVLAEVLVGESLAAAGRTMADALPFWRAALEPSAATVDWQLLAAVPLVAIALLAVLPRFARGGVVAGGAVVATLALPASVDVAWWVPSTVDITVASVLILGAIVAPAKRTAVAVAVSAGALGVHAVVTGLARPENTAAILAAVVLVGAAASLASRSTIEDCPPHRRAIGGTGLFLSLLALPPAVGAALASVDVTPWWVTRLAAASVLLVLLALVLVRRWLAPLVGYAFAAVLTSAVIWSAVPLLGDTTESVGVYAAAGLVVIAAATAVLLPGSRLTPAAACATPTALLLAIDVIPPSVTALVTPYAWLGAVWSGAPNGVGFTPPGHGLDSAEIRGVHAVALAGLALAVAVGSYAVKRTAWAAAGGLFVGGPAAIVIGLAAAHPSWPTIATVSLLLGLGLVVFAAMARLVAPVAALTALQGVTLTGAGLAGSLPEKWSTLTALGLIVVASAAVGAAGRTLGARVAGWLMGVASALTLIVAAARAADLPLRDAALPVLALAAITLAGGTALGRRAAEGRTAEGGAAAGRAVEGRAAKEPGRATESVAMQGAAHASAVVALLMTVGSLRYAAAVCTVWGIAVGLRALWPGTGRSARAVLTAAAAGCELLAWWLLLVDLDVAVLEAYTVPLAGVALLAGWAARRAQPAVHSWVAYGPALLAAFLPSLATIVFTEGEPLRRFLLGVGALAVVVAGSARRQQAPVVIGGVVLALVALHELVLFWDRLPRWMPLAAGGLLLVGLATTYERRRRDLARLRESVGRMG